MRIAGRQVLLMVYSFYKTSVDNGTVYDVEDVIAATLHHNQMEHFLHRWDQGDFRARRAHAREN